MNNQYNQPNQLHHPPGHVIGNLVHNPVVTTGNPAGYTTG